MSCYVFIGCPRRPYQKRNTFSIDFIFKGNGLEIAVCSLVAKDIGEKTPKICTAYVIPLPNKLVPKKCKTSRTFNDDSIFYHTVQYENSLESLPEILGTRFSSPFHMLCDMMGVQMQKTCLDIRLGTLRIVTKTSSTNS